MKRLSLILALAGVLAVVVGCDAPAPAPTPSLYPAPTLDTKFERIEKIQIKRSGSSQETECLFGDCGLCEYASITPEEKVARIDIDMLLENEITNVSYYWWIESLSDEYQISAICPFFDYTSMPETGTIYYQNKYERTYSLPSIEPSLTHHFVSLFIHVPQQVVNDRIEAKFVIKLYSRHTGRYFVSPEITIKYIENNNLLYHTYIY